MGIQEDQLIPRPHHAHQHGFMNQLRCRKGGPEFILPDRSARTSVPAGGGEPPGTAATIETVRTRGIIKLIQDEECRKDHAPLPQRLSAAHPGGPPGIRGIRP